MKDLSQQRQDGKSTKKHLKGLCEETAKNIKDCGNTCDVYLKKTLITKIIAGSI
jgi:hypothetical protein